MKNFASAVKGADALSSREMKNVKGGGNCGFRFSSIPSKPGRVICDLEESQQSYYEQYAGKWCCNNCDEIGC